MLSSIEVCNTRNTQNELPFLRKDNTGNEVDANGKTKRETNEKGRMGIHGKETGKY